MILSIKIHIRKFIKLNTKPQNRKKAQDKYLEPFLGFIYDNEDYSMVTHM